MPPSDRHKPLLSSHPLAIALTFTVVLFLLGSTILARRTGTPAPETQPGGWANGSVTLTNPTSFSPVYMPDAAVTPTSATDTPPFYTYAQVTTTTTGKEPESFDFNAFVRQLTDTSAALLSGRTSGGAGTDPEIQTVYSFIPQGLISTSSAKTRTPGQEALFRYGNAAGSIIKGFEAAHPDIVAVLSAQATDRTNALKAQALRDVGYAFRKVGENLMAMRDVPASALEAHAALAKGYVAIGGKLALVADAVPDKEFLAAITAYNAVADGFTRDYIALATVFSVSGVSFSSGDAGSAFTFSNSSAF